ncbi:MAG: polysaccharide biosynthesis tyrosine autokinase [Oscillochloridaceae bacterium]|nr:polysaccharide biosynthesis tyrosine autokinase [Chloroflexaceae bacterium]MDW8389218.1 polysaccharide biosynthesis tyrosine autokinase [Oscillochloridaceae bacterium]
MEFKAFANLLWRWAWLIALISLLSGALAYVVSLQITPTYESRTTVTVTRRSAPDSEIWGVNERPIATYMELLRKRPVLESVIARLQLNTTPEALERRVRVSLTRNTPLIVLTVRDSDPERAAAIANEIVNLVAQQGRELLGNDVTFSRYNLYVVEPALPATRPASPRIPLNVAVFMVVGAMLAAGGILLREYFDDRVRSANQITRLTGARTLVTVPPQAAGPDKPVVLRDALSPVAETYRRLRVHIEHAAKQRPIHTLLVTSAADGEGKSTTLANLAVVLAESGKRVILVDTDLRKPTLHTIFQQPNTRGVTTALYSDAASLASHLTPTGVTNLDLLPSGPLPANPAEVIGSSQMASLVERLKRHADIVLFDSPALLAVADPITLARLCDATVLVVRSGRLRSDALVSALDQLAQFEIEPLGVVLNAHKGEHRRYYQTRSSRPSAVPARSPQTVTASRDEPGGTTSTSGYPAIAE